MTTEPLQLAWGFHTPLVPDDATALWGARWIVTQDGYVDVVPDRTDLVAATPEAKAALVQVLTDGAGDAAIAAVRTGLAEGRIRTREARTFTLYRDERVHVLGNSNASAGYFYVTAVLLDGLLAPLTYGMFSDEGDDGNVAVRNVLDRTFRRVLDNEVTDESDLLSLIGNGLANVAKSHPEVYDTVVREEVDEAIEHFLAHSGRRLTPSRTEEFIL